MPTAQPAVATADDGPVVAAPHEGLRDRKKRATRRALRLAALRLIAERGLEQVTTDDIAAAADVSPRTFFNYFATKVDALVGNDPELGPQLARELLARPAHESIVDALQATLTEYARTVLLDREVWQLRSTVLARHPELVGAMVAQTTAIEDALAQAIATRTGRDPQTDPYPSLVAAVVVAVSRSALRHLGERADAAALAALVHAHFDTLRHGLTPPD